jgi:uncharacterized FlaG/YvyC family protein
LCKTNARSTSSHTIDASQVALADAKQRAESAEEKLEETRKEMKEEIELLRGHIKALEVRMLLR